MVVVAALTTGLAATVSAAPSLPSCAVADTLTVQRAMSDWNQSVLDTHFRLSSAYVPKDLRSTASASLNGGHKVRKIVLADLGAMARAAKTAGARLAVESAYRSYTTQRSTFAYWVRVGGYAEALRTSARAGHSEHQLGTTIDFKSSGGRAPWYYVDWATTKAGKWLKANAWKYGFIMSYPKGKTAVTCYSYEPWHYRYVGKTVAKQVHASGVTLREFLWAQQVSPTPTPSPTPSETPTPTSTPSETPTPTPTSTADPTPTQSPTPSPTAG
jgi:zinc D-Ala-D-Ala carboxypeptidase